MIYIIRFSTLVFLIYGFNRIFRGIFRVPSFKAYRMANKMAGMNQGSGAVELFIQGVVNFLSSRIHLSESKETKLRTMLRYFDEPVSPKVFAARQITGSLLLAFPAIFIYFIFPMPALVMLFMAVLFYFKTELDLENRYKLKRMEIEYELPRFCATILQEIKLNRDVIGLIERYISGSGKALKRELEITLADMKSSNQEAALIRMESRLSLGAVSDIVRGLVGVVRGDDERAYFEMLSHDMDATELHRLEAKAAGQPEKIKKYQFFILLAMMCMYVITIAVYLLNMDKPDFF